jgi:hypothetical protein
MVRQRLHWSATIGFILPTLVGTPRLSAAAQGVKEVTLALVRALPDSSATATIIREAGPNGRTLILLREQNADPAALATALTALSRSRQKHGDAPTKELVITLHGHRTVASLTAAERRLTDDYVSRLRLAKSEDLAGFGRARRLVVSIAWSEPGGRG